MVDHSLSPPSRLWPHVLIALVLHSLSAIGLVLGSGFLSESVPQMEEMVMQVEMVAPLNQELAPGSFETPDEALEEKPLPKPKKIQKKQMSQRTSNVVPPQSASGIGLSDVTPLFQPAPFYPEEARRKKIQGTVLAHVFITASGTVTKVTVISSPDPLLTAAALKSLQQWRFSKGEKVVEIPVEFRIES